MRARLPTECQKYKTRCGAPPRKREPKHHVGLALNQRFEHQRIFCRIVFQVGVLNDDEVAGGFLNAAAERGAFAHILRLKNDADLRMLRLQLGENLARAIAASRHRRRSTRSRAEPREPSATTSWSVARSL